jgi:predicted DNA-binding transcriptional regulator AlpA
MSKLRIEDLHDDRVLSDKEAHEVGLLPQSRTTLWHLDRAGEGPPKIRLSDRRWGRRVGDIKRWLRGRTHHRQEMGHVRGEATVAQEGIINVSDNTNSKHRSR